MQLGALKREMVSLRDTAQVHRNIMSVREAMLKAKTLAAQGVPCYARGNHVYHAVTKALL